MIKLTKFHGIWQRLRSALHSLSLIVPEDIVTGFAQA